MNSLILVKISTMTTSVYLDYAAATPVDPRVVEKMMAYLTKEGHFANPSASHSFGKVARAALEHARKQVADLIHAEPNEIIWTSGATEANNLALKGVAQLYQQKGKHIVTVKTEHPSVLETCQWLEKAGYQVTYLTPNRNGLINLEQFCAALRRDTILVSMMHVNNETGVIQDIAAIGAETSKREILLHVDGVQSAGKISIDVNAMHIDLLSLSAHKVYGPKGVGALYVRKTPRVRIAAQVHGSGQESGMRSGTLPTHQIVGMGEAFSLAEKEMQENDTHIRRLRDVFIAGISQIPSISLTIDPKNCVPGIINIGVEGVASKDIMQAIPQIAISSGAACNNKGIEPSYVLRALGLSFEAAQCCVRISLGRYTTLQEIQFVIESLKQVADKQRQS